MSERKGRKKAAIEIMEDRLQTLLIDRLDAKSAREVMAALGQNGQREMVLDLLDELGDVSSKVRGEAIWALGEVSRVGRLSCVGPWLDLGITLAEASGALGLRFFKESPAILGFLPATPRTGELLRQVLELADGAVETAPQCAFEFFKVLPRLPEDICVSELQEWAHLGMELAQWDYVLGNEFFRECPAVISAIPFGCAKAWIAFGMKLMVRNSLGKPDYVGTLEFFRTSPRLLADIPVSEVKQLVIDMGNTLAEQMPEIAVLFLAEAPDRLSNLPSREWQLRVLQFGLLVADKDAQAALAYFRRVSEVLLYADATATGVFDAWFGQGMEALEYSVEAGRAFFGLETKQACSAVEQAMTGVPLRQVLRSLRMFARALCGEEVSIDSLSKDFLPGQDGFQSDLGRGHERTMVSPDGKTIYLPLVMGRSSTVEGNRRWYTAMVAHEVGHLEFGTYRVSDRVIQQVAARVRSQRSHFDHVSSSSPIHSLGGLFELYPQSALIRDLWETIEDARVDFLLKKEYPGLCEDFRILNRESIQLRTLTHGMTAREIVLDALLLRFAELEQEVVSSAGLDEVIEPVWELARSILHAEATADDAVLLADALYQELERRIGHWRPSSDQSETFSGETGEERAGVAHEAAEHFEEAYESFENWGYRSALDPHALSGVSDDQETQETSGTKGKGEGARAEGQGMGADSEVPPAGAEREHNPPERAAEYGESAMKQWLSPDAVPGGQRKGAALGEGQFLYEEWDGFVKDYRPQWTRVVEQEAPDGPSEFVDETLRTYNPVVKLIRRYFECIRPEAFRRIGRQADGEEIDFDALVNWFVDRKRGGDPSEHIYAHRQKRDRQVAVAFLVDMSGSTARQLGSRGRTVNDLEKEGLLLLSEALSAVGDQFAIYGFSGKSRQLVDLQILKDFSQRAGGRVGLKISGVRPRQQNRDGAAIRHATFRLMEQPAKVRMMVLLSDGKPLDDEYTDEYSLEDTKMALREARLKGIHPFCITIDQAPTDYVKRMYGEVGYLVVDAIDSLPTRLPKIYQRLTAG